MKEIYKEIDTNLIYCTLKSNINITTLLDSNIKSLLFVYGESSIKSNGIYNDLIFKLNKMQLKITEYENVHYIPTQTKINNTIKGFKNINFDGILCVGGNSVIDTSKYISQYFKIPLYTIPTIISNNSVLSPIFIVKDKNEQLKIFNNKKCIPKKSLICTDFFTSIPFSYNSYSSITIFSNLVQNFDNNKNNNILIKQLIDSTNKILIDPGNIQARELITKIALSTITNIKSILFILSISLTNLFYIPYGASVSMILPAWLKYKNLRVKEFINYTELDDWLHSLGSPIRLNEFNIFENKIPIIINEALKLTKELELDKDISKNEIINILELASDSNYDDD